MQTRKIREEGNSGNIWRFISLLEMFPENKPIEQIPNEHTVHERSDEVAAVC